MDTGGTYEPQQARDIQEFVAGLRHLKERAGLTYRQLEERAAARGEVLPRSTLADVLGGKTAPRPELLAAFVRACGDGARVAEWMAAWEALTRQTPGEEPGDDAAPPSPEPGRRPVRLLMAGAAAVLCLAVGAVWAVAASDDDGASDSAGSQQADAAGTERTDSADTADVEPGATAERATRASPSESADPLPEGPLWIRPLLGDDLCLTDGKVPQYRWEVAVQRPCAELSGHRTRLLPVGEELHKLEWWRAEQGEAGCLEVMGSPAPGLLQPMPNCAGGDVFSVVPTGEGGDQYLLRVREHGCLTIKGASRAANVEARMEPCQEDLDSQVFLIQPAP